MQKAELLNVLKPKVAEAWLNSYHLPFPTSNRDFSMYWSPILEIMR